MIAELNVIYTPEHAKTKSLQAQLNTVEESYLTARTALAGKIGEQYREALRKERLLADGFLAQSGQVISEQERTTKYSLLKAEAESERQLYDSLQQQLKQASVTSAMKTSNIRIVDAAAVATRPYKPNTSRSVIVGTLLGLFGAVGIALAAPFFFGDRLAPMRIGVDTGGTFTDLRGAAVGLNTTTVLATNGVLHGTVQRELGLS